jgi:hypothetical protein
MGGHGWEREGLPIIISSRQQLTHWRTRSPSWEPDSRSPILQFRKLLRVPKVYYLVHKNPPMDSEPDQFSPHHPTLFLYEAFGFRASIYVSVFLLVSLLLIFPPKLCTHPYLHHICYMTCPSNPLWLHFNYNWWRVQIIHPLIMQYSLTSHYFILWAQMSSSAPCSQTSSVHNIVYLYYIVLYIVYCPCSSLNVRDQVSRTYRISRKERTN